MSEGTDKTEDLQAKLDDLYQQENQIFEKHKDVWEKVFSKMSKTDAGSGDYADYLASTVEANKKSSVLSVPSDTDAESAFPESPFPVHAVNDNATQRCLGKSI